MKDKHHNINIYGGTNTFTDFNNQTKHYEGIDVAGILHRISQLKQELIYYRNNNITSISTSSCNCNNTEHIKRLKEQLTYHQSLMERKETLFLGFKIEYDKILELKENELIQLRKENEMLHSIIDGIQSNEPSMLN